MIPTKIVLRGGPLDAQRRDLQQHLDDVHQILNGGVTVAGQFGKPISFTWSTASQPAVPLPFTTRPIALWLMSVVDQATPAIVAGNAVFTWTWKDGAITITSIAGAVGGHSYTVTFVALPS